MTHDYSPTVFADVACGGTVVLGLFVEKLTRKVEREEVAGAVRLVEAVDRNCPQRQLAVEGQVDGINAKNCKVAEKGHQIHRRLMAELMIFAEKQEQADIELVEAQKESSVLVKSVRGCYKVLYGEEYAPVTDGAGASGSTGRAEDVSLGSKSSIALFRTMGPR
ncbi:unnamed protein product [Heligmosomoides polygyrus]|uniref:Methyltranfer_dom domain-containing protein n=1 Tax=Heligmosomoides polygyrus TaxID=6339 RepID=A0A183FZ55_HELPZ|nr:unnamed protein product [Heligmosomoides polygyrus]